MLDPGGDSCACFFSRFREACVECRYGCCSDIVLPGMAGILAARGRLICWRALRLGLCSRWVRGIGRREGKEVV